jgi:hypothetical protein
MFIRELFNEAGGNVWGRKGTKTVRKYRCTYGPRKGRAMSSPAACNKPLDIQKSVTLKQTKQKKGGSMKVKSKLTKRSNSASVRLKKLNKPRRPSNRARKI